MLSVTGKKVIEKKKDFGKQRFDMKKMITPVFEQDDEFMNVSETSNFLNIKQSMLRGLILKKKIPFVKIGKLIRLEKAEIKKWIVKNRKGE